ncbi:energy-coupling factor ABC transporter ATP-binding protein [Inconstantimicrobium porci]|uniref:ABC transporter ATP-binding protein n=1 Tax=Inconstantimicrobium porci TaxID=2652291 RepID=A0A7X2N078_9CLOT|nr:ABC transporter ATP-binding protein [Inconstantimicrobium porci]MDD6769485.1 ABC transporter ATP-binding protein [Inconstantimicrobium porci]MSR92361.1 ABC transporter ATP-binding protein [Inconstantimicrobium porci]
MDKIVVKNLCFKYKENKEETLSDINLMFDNRSTAIIGQNGAGKTTFVKLLKGLLKQNSGEIIVCGKDTKDSTAAELAKYIGLVFQNPNDQIFKSKVIDEVMFGPLNIGMSSETARKNSVEALKILGLDNLIDENPYDLGLSERKLITIASIVAMDTDIIIFDEPTIAQDFAGKEKIKRLIKELRNKGKTVLTIIHDMDFVAEVFERTIVFNKGRVILDGNTKDVYSNEEILKKAYLELPHVTQLCRQLGYNETFLTVDDFVEFYKNN